MSDNLLEELHSNENSIPINGNHNNNNNNNNKKKDSKVTCKCLKIFLF